MEVMGGLSRAEGRRQRKELEKQIARDLRRRARAKLAELKEAIGAAKRRRKEAIGEARQSCRTGRAAAKLRAKMLRVQVLETLKRSIRADRDAARVRCDSAKREAKSLAPVARARAALLAERQYRRELRIIEQGQKRQKREIKRSTKKERAGESDDEVRANIPADMVPLFERVRSRIKPSGRTSRTEAFLKYAEEHAGEVVEAIEDASERRLAELLAQRESVTRFARKRRYTAAELAEVPF